MSKERIITEQDVPKAVHEAVAEGHKIVAIKLLQEATGIGLANAKVIVDRIATAQSLKRPEHSAITEVSNAPKVLGLLVFIGAIVVVWRYFLGS